MIAVNMFFGLYANLRFGFMPCEKEIDGCKKIIMQPVHIMKKQKKTWPDQVYEHHQTKWQKETPPERLELSTS
jgi:hypothetical protein